MSVIEISKEIVITVTQDYLEEIKLTVTDEEVTLSTSRMSRDVFESLVEALLEATGG